MSTLIIWTGLCLLICGTGTPIYYQTSSCVLGIQLWLLCWIFLDRYGINLHNYPDIWINSSGVRDYSPYLSMITSECKHIFVLPYTLWLLLCSCTAIDFWEFYGADKMRTYMYGLAREAGLCIVWWTVYIQPYPWAHSQLVLPGQFEKLGMVLGMRLHAYNSIKGPLHVHPKVCNREMDVLGE